jgi:SAM-dependent methyltransferase
MAARDFPRTLLRMMSGRSAPAPRGAAGLASRYVPSTPVVAYELELAEERTRPDVLRGAHKQPVTVGLHPFAMGEQYSLTLRPGDVVHTPDIAFGADHVLVVEAAPAGDATGSLTLEASLQTLDPLGRAMSVPLFVLSLGAAQRKLRFELSPYAGTTGRVRLTCAGASPDATCHLATLRICPRLDEGRINAFGNYGTRLQREGQHFSGTAYTHPIYGRSVIPREGSGSTAVETAVPIVAGGRSDFRDRETMRAKAILAALTPGEQELAFDFAMRGLTALLPMAPPNFFQRAADMSAARPLTMLSLCAGAARIEEMIIAYCQGPVTLTLQDASLDLIGRAAERLQAVRPNTSVRCLVGDVNNGLPGQGEFDVILCVSGLHHVADLEGVLSQINERLADTGEFWSIGEQIGRNGNRLWPEARLVADQAMAMLPERLRKNAHTGRIDDVLDDRDYSINCFEGIRSEELESLLEAYLVPVQVYKRNAFLWRLIDTTYIDNYSLRSDDDVAHLKQLVLMEAVHWLCGGRSTELHGVYAKKRIGTAAF